jgi:hypothetical protein
MHFMNQQILKSICCDTSILGDVGFDDREILRDASGIDDSLYTNRSSIRPVEPDEKTLNEHTSEKPMDVDLNPAVDNDDFGGAVDGGFMGKCCVCV